MNELFEHIPNEHTQMNKYRMMFCSHLNYLINSKPDKRKNSTAFDIKLEATIIIIIHQSTNVFVHTIDWFVRRC